MTENECLKNTVKAVIKATKLRAKVYAYLYEEILKNLEEKKADKIFQQAIYRLGTDKSKKFSKNSKKNAKILAKDFISDPASRAVFKQKVLSSDRKKTRIQMKNCPLVEMWKEIGLSRSRIEKLCSLANQTDFGCIEKLGYKLKFFSRIADNGKECILEITKD